MSGTACKSQPPLTAASIIFSIKAIRAPPSAHPADHADIDRIRLGDARQRLAGTATPDRLGTLVVRQLALAAKLDAVGHRPLAAVTSSLADQVALEPGDSS